MSRISLALIAIGAVGLLALEASAAHNRSVFRYASGGNDDLRNHPSHQSVPTLSPGTTILSETHVASPPPITSQAKDASGDVVEKETDAEDIEPEEHTYPIIRVIDGDTFVVSINGMHEIIRLIGVNAPETAGAHGKECFGLEAAGALQSLLFNTHVSLTSDPTQADRDKYGRLLRYSYLPDGRLLNKVLIQNGYTYEYTFRVPYQYQAEFQNAEQEAQYLQKGLWAESACHEDETSTQTSLET